MQTKKEALLAIYRHECPEFIPAENLITADIVMPGDRYFGPEKEGLDMWGVCWTQLGPNPALDGNIPTPGQHLLDDITKWEEVVKFPQIDYLPLDKIFGEMTKHIDREKTVVKGLLLSGLFERMHHFMEMENALCAFYEEPEAVHSFFKAMADYKIKCINKLIEFINPDIIHMHDDWGMATNMMFSPEIWREFFKPHEARFAEHIHSKGKLYEHHSCGYIMPIIGDLIEIGVDSIEPLNVCNDIVAIKKEYGNKITLTGGLNNQYLDRGDVSEEMVRAEVRRTLDLYAPGGNYIPYMIYSNQEKLNIINDEVEKYGAIIYKK